MVLGTPLPSRAKAAACSFLGASLIVVRTDKTKTISLSNHFLRLAKYVAAVCSDFDFAAFQHARIYQLPKLEFALVASYVRLAFFSLS